MGADGFWDYVNKWTPLYKTPLTVAWDKTWIKNDYCESCRFCCGKQDSNHPFPMPLLPDQARPDLDEDFHLLDSLTPYLAAAGCRACATNGCRLSKEQKPIACRLFPIVIVNGGLYLYQNCPSVLFTPLIQFLELAKSAAEMLDKLDLSSLRRLSLWLTAEILAANYIDLKIRLFDEHGKKLQFI